MEETIYTICAQLKIGEITVNEATDQLLRLFDVSKRKINPTDTETYWFLMFRDKLPEFCRAVDSAADTILLHHSAFSFKESELLGEAVKYACLRGKEVTVIPD